MDSVTSTITLTVSRIIVHIPAQSKYMRSFSRDTLFAVLEQSVLHILGKNHTKYISRHVLISNLQTNTFDRSYYSKVKLSRCSLVAKTL